MVFTPEEQWKIFGLYFERTEGQRRSYNEIARQFTADHPNRPCNSQAVSALLTRLQVCYYCQPI